MNINTPYLILLTVQIATNLKRRNQELGSIIDQLYADIKQKDDLISNLQEDNQRLSDTLVKVLSNQQKLLQEHELKVEQNLQNSFLVPQLLPTYDIEDTTYLSDDIITEKIMSLITTIDNAKKCTSELKSNLQRDKVRISNSSVL